MNKPSPQGRVSPRPTIKQGEKESRGSFSSFFSEKAKSSSKEVTQRRQRSIPAMVYDENLPVSAHREEIANAIRNHQVVVLCGETGSGKSTQLPKICLEMGLGIRKRLAHTQPRRIAAISIATRVGEELKQGKQWPSEEPLIPPDKLVGYKIRFTDQTSPDTCIKLMTDGMLLAETQHDPFLNQYEVIIIDEAHERSLNIDFLIGILRRLVEKRPDLKVIITSATIDARRFAEHFETEQRHVPILEISGRTYPVEVIYQPPSEEEKDSDGKSFQDGDLQQGILEALETLSLEERGDVLIFLPTERDIHEMVHLLQGEQQRRQRGFFRNETVDVLPLYARLPAPMQQKIFQMGKKRRLVLATNVAESSVTVPGIRYVIDTGTARISRYSARTKTQRLPIEPISQASADQRKGRCGRIGPGICIRLYSEEDYRSRETYTMPEIQRTNLASVILQTKMLNLGRVEVFPFLDAPKSATIRDGYKTLFELQALTQPSGEGKLTPLGKQLSQIPVDPRIGRMILFAMEEARQNSGENVLTEVLILAAALEIRDPRERPVEKQAAADAAHQIFLDSRSDFLALLKIWDMYHQWKRKLTRNQLQKACRQNFLSWNRMREWIDVYHQLREWVEQTDRRRETSRLLRGDATQVISPDLFGKKYAPIHRALLSGLLSNLGNKSPTSQEYLVGGGGKSFLWPGSGLSKQVSGKGEKSVSAQEKGGMETSRHAPKAGVRYFGKKTPDSGKTETGSEEISAQPVKKTLPAWIMAAEMVETSKRFLRTLAEVESGWIEPLAEHLVSRTYSEPHWSKQNNSVMVYEKVTLFGLVVVPRRRIPYGPIDPVASREIFIQQGLVEGNWKSNAPFYQYNQELWQHLQQVQAKLRQYDFLPNSLKVYDFYDQRIPLEVVDRGTMEKWLQALQRGEARGANNLSGKETLESLKMQESDLLNEPVEETLEERFPDFLPGRTEVVLRKPALKMPEKEPESEESSLPTQELWLFGQVAPQLKKKPVRKNPPSVVPAAVSVKPSTEISQPTLSRSFPLEYHFEPGETTDGVMLHATLETVPQIDPLQLEWGIPGFLVERITALIKSLPREVRRKLIPAPDTARTIAARLTFGEGRFLTVLAHELTRLAGEVIREKDLDLQRIPESLQINIRVTDATGKQVVQSRDFQTILKNVGNQVPIREISHTNNPWTRSGLTSWNFGNLPICVETTGASGESIPAYPMLEDEGSTAAVRLATSLFHAETTSRRGILRLFRIHAHRDLIQQAQWLPKLSEMEVHARTFTQKYSLSLVETVGDLLAHGVLEPEGFPALADMPSLLREIPRTQEEFEKLCKTARGRIPVIVQEATVPLQHLWKAYAEAIQAIDMLYSRSKTTSKERMQLGKLSLSTFSKDSVSEQRTPIHEWFRPILTDIEKQLERLMPRDFLLTTSWKYGQHFPRYLRGIRVRLENLLHSNAGIQNARTRGAEQMAELAAFQKRYETLAENFRLRQIEDSQLEAFRWMLEEYRISLFAQKLGTAQPVSARRLEKILESLEEK